MLRLVDLGVGALREQHRALGGRLLQRNECVTHGSSLSPRLRAKWQRDECSGEMVIKGGSERQISAAIGQRVLNRQPDGMLSGLGMSPCVAAGRVRFTRSILG